jgi:hypothetical protein
MPQRRTRSITIAALLMIVFGFAEIITGFTLGFFGLRTTERTASTYVGAAIGALYAAAGLTILTMRRGAAIVALVLLAMVVVGRLFMVAMGLYPLDTLTQTAAMITGTAIALGLGIFIVLKRSSFR